MTYDAERGMYYLPDLIPQTEPAERMDMTAW